ncbi:DNA-processing protein DprA [bacterium]|nr:DNA-processing protein DprA [bacterium]
MKFNKFEVAYMLQNEGVGRKYIYNHISTQGMFNIEEGILKDYQRTISSLGIKIVSCVEPEYPHLLKEIYDYPLVLFCKGDVSLLSKHMITMVGTREMSEYGKWCVKYILKGLKEEDVVVVSGLARGIDAQVHRTCLDLGIPTIAVVAGGLDKGYPRSNEGLYQEICKKGLVISEFPYGRTIVKGMFPMRNRILAGMALASAIVESGEEGGSLITARLSIEYGREMFCIPCGINRFALQGCNMLLERGATPLYSIDQIKNFLEERTTDWYSCDDGEHGVEGNSENTLEMFEPIKGGGGVYRNTEVLALPFLDN